MSAPSNQPGGAPELYWWKLPDDEERMMALKPSELRCYMVVARAIQKDKNKGHISERQVASRARVSLRHVHSALNALVESGWLSRSGKAGATATFALPHGWKGENCIPTGKQLGADSGPQGEQHRFPTGEQNCIPTGKQLGADSGPQGEQHRFPTGEQNCIPTGKQHLDSLEFLEPSSSSTEENGRSEQSAETGPATTTSGYVNGKDQTKPAPWSDVDRDQAREAMRSHFGTFEPPDLDLTREVLAHMQGLDDVRLWLADLTERRVKIKGWGFYLHDAKNWPSRRADVLGRELERRAAMEAQASAKAQADAAAIAEGEAAIQELQRQQEAGKVEVKAAAKPKHRRCDRCDNTGLVAAPEDASLAAFCGCDIGKERSLREPDLVAKDNENRRRLLGSVAARTPDLPRTPRSIRERHVHGNRRVSR